MAEFKISGRMAVKNFKKQFKEVFGASLRVYKGDDLADDNATLASIRAEGSKGGEFTLRANTLVGNFEAKMQELFGIKVQVADADDKELVSDALTLGAVSRGEVKKEYGATAGTGGCATTPTDKKDCPLKCEVAVDRDKLRDKLVKLYNLDLLHGDKLAKLYNLDLLLVRKDKKTSLVDMDGKQFTPPAKEKSHRYRVELSTKYAYEVSMIELDKEEVGNIEDMDAMEKYFHDQDQDIIDCLSGAVFPLDAQPEIFFTVYDENDNVVFDSAGDPYGDIKYEMFLEPDDFEWEELPGFIQGIEADADKLDLLNKLLARKDEEKETYAPGYYLTEFNNVKWQTHTLYVYDEGEFDPDKFCLIANFKMHDNGDGYCPTGVMSDVEHLIYNGRMVEVEEVGDWEDNFLAQYAVMRKDKSGFWSCGMNDDSDDEE